MTWLIGAGFAAVLASIVVLYVRMQARSSRLPAQDELFSPSAQSS